MRKSPFLLKKNLSLACLQLYLMDITKVYILLLEWY